jgi:enoyl-CoA hydratase/carnithine racemase
MSQYVTTHRDGHIGTIVLHNPPHNHVNVTVLRALADALDAFDADSNCRVVLLRAEGRSFCAGADLAKADGLGGGPVDPLRDFYDQAERLFAHKKPIVAAIQGAAVGAGLGVALAADFRVASTSARFAANFTRLGFHPGFALTFTLPRAIGVQHASLMFMTSRRVKAEEALALGLVDILVSPDDLDAAARTLALEIAENAPLSTIATRKTIRGDFCAQAHAALIREHAAQTPLRDTADYAEGVASVFERRAPHFIGR